MKDLAVVVQTVVGVVQGAANIPLPGLDQRVGEALAVEAHHSIEMRLQELAHLLLLPDQVLRGIHPDQAEFVDHDVVGRLDEPLIRAEGLLGIVRALQAGAVVALTPDGPRGPRERVQPGAIAAAQHAGVPIVAAGARVSSAWYLRSWDRMCIPKPFASVDVRFSAPIPIGPGKDGLRLGIAAVQRTLHEVNGTEQATP